MQKLFIITVLLFLLSGCRNIPDTTPESRNSKTFVAIDKVDTNKIQTGSLKKVVMEKTIECRGVLEISPDGIYLVSTPDGGKIKKIYASIGEYVKKGNRLVCIENPEFITLQQDYLETKHQLEYCQEEFKRQGELTLENATSIKKMQKAQSDYWSLQVHLNALAARLRLLGINPEKVKNQDFISHITIYSPTDGYISEITACTGQYVNAENPIFKLVSKNFLQLVLQLPESEITNVSKGMHIHYSLRSDPLQIYSATITKTGVEVHPATNNINVYATPAILPKNALPGTKIKACISFPPDSLYALPINAIFWEGESCYAIVKDKRFFRKVKVMAGFEQNGFLEIKNADEFSNRSVVVHGLENVYQYLK